MKYILSNKSNSSYKLTFSLYLKKNVLIQNVKSSLGSLLFKSKITGIKNTVNKSNKYFFKHKRFKNNILKLKANSYLISNGSFIDLLIVGLGFRVSHLKKLQYLFFELHFSHKLTYKIPQNIVIHCLKKKITLFSLDNSLLFTTAEEIKSLRFPNIYKGKGIKYVQEVLKLKPGKQR